MKKAVLISIRPKWCALIASHKKTLEIRKTRPKIETPFKCYIYETQEKTETPWWMSDDGHLVCHGHGAVIGEFICDQIEEIAVAFDGGSGPMKVIGGNEVWYGGMVQFLSRLSTEDICRYIGGIGRKGYGWHISDLKFYDKPKRIFDFVRPACERVSDCGGGCSYWCSSLRRCMRSYIVLFPPQSWMYVEELP